jgi:hypothetical protein
MGVTLLVDGHESDVPTPPADRADSSIHLRVSMRLNDLDSTAVTQALDAEHSLRRVRGRDLNPSDTRLL